MAAEKLQKKLSGAFSALVSAGAKYGLVSQKDGKLSIQPLYREIKLAYTDEERRQKLRQAVLSPPLFQAIATRFAGQILPVEHFEKLLIREFAVPEEMASKVATYFVVGAKQAGVLSPENTLVATTNSTLESKVTDRSDESPESDSEHDGDGDDASSSPRERDSATTLSDYSISVRGPGLHSTILVREDDDLVIVDAMLGKVRKALQARSQK